MSVSAFQAQVAVRKYLGILLLAARESQDAVQDALRHQITSGQAIDVELIRQMVSEAIEIKPVTDIEVEPPNLNDFDELLHTFDKESPNDESTNNPQDPIEWVVRTAASACCNGDDSAPLRLGEDPISHSGNEKQDDNRDRVLPRPTFDLHGQTCLKCFTIGGIFFLRSVMAAGALVSLSRELYTLSRRLDWVDLLPLPARPPM